MKIKIDSILEAYFTNELLKELINNKEMDGIKNPPEKIQRIDILLSCKW